MKDFLILVVNFLTQKESLEFFGFPDFRVSTLGKFPDFKVLLLVKMTHPSLLWVENVCCLQ